MANSVVRLLITKRNGRTLTYPTYENIVCERMEGVVNLAAGGARFQSRAGDRVIPVQYECEQTISQIKSLCNKCCDSTSA